MVEAREFCPDCGFIDLIITGRGFKDPTGKSLASAECPHCGWRGPLSDTLGAVTGEQFWDTERVGNVLLNVLSKHAAGPLVQCLEFIGLLPKKKLLNPGEHATKQQIEEIEKHNRLAQQARDATMRQIMEAAITAAFEEAEKQNRLFAIATNTDIHHVLKEQDEESVVFGGNVTPMKARPRKSRRTQGKRKK